MNIIDPDYNIELFWYGFKQSMINFYNKQEYYEYINVWSDILNILKKDKKYDIKKKNFDVFNWMYRCAFSICCYC